MRFVVGTSTLIKNIIFLKKRKLSKKSNPKTLHHLDAHTFIVVKLARHPGLKKPSLAPSECTFKRRCASE